MAEAQGGEVQVSIGAAWSSGFSSAFKSADGQIEELGASVRDMDRKLSSVKGFRSMTEDAEQAGAAFRHSENQLRAYSHELAGLESITDEQKQRFKELERETKALKRQFDQKTQAAQKMGASLREAGLDTSHLTAEQKKLEAQVAQTQRRMEGMSTFAGANVGEAFGRIGGHIRGLATEAAVAGAGIGYAFKTQFVDVAAQFEKFHTILETTEGSAAKADKAMSWISDFAAKTPYDVTKVTEAFVKLRAYGLDPANGLLKTLGDTSAAMGKDVDQAVEAIADAVTGENERLKEFGIKGSVNKGKTTYEYTDREGKQKTATVDSNNRNQIQATLEAIWNSKYGNAMDKMSKTWEGMVSNIGDQWTRFTNMVMSTGLFDNMKKKLETVLNTLNTWAADGTLAAYAKKLGDGITYVVDEMWSLGKATWANVSAVTEAVGGWKNLALILVGLKLAPLAVSLVQLGGSLFVAARGAVMFLSAGGAMGSIVGTLGGAFGALGAAIAATPIGWIVAGLAAIAAGAYAVWKYWDQISAFGSGFWSAIAADMGPLGDTLRIIGEGFGIVVGWVQKGIGWISSLTGQAKATTEQLDAAKAAGQSWGAAFVNVVSLVTLPLQGLVKLIGSVLSGINAIATGATTIGGAYKSVKASIGDAIDSGAGKVKAFFGFDGGDKATPAAAPVATPTAVPANPTGTGQTSVSQSFSTNNTITVTGAENPEATAKAVSAELERRDREKALDRRASMTDAVGY